MQQILSSLQLYNEYIILGLIVWSLILLLILIIYISKLNKLRKRYDKLMIREGVNLEDILIDYKSSVDQVGVINKKVTNIEEKLQNCAQKIGVVRYNALQGPGAELSFAVAVLDTYNNGFVLNGIYTRDGSYTYAKEIKNAQSVHNLTEEEKLAIDKAIKAQ